MSKSVIGRETVQHNESVADRPLLNELRDHLLARLPGRVRRIVLFGSRARGEFDESSDVDVLVVLEDCAPSLMDRARAARYEVMEQWGFQPLISLLLLSEQEWQELSKHSAGLKHNIEYEGLAIWPTT
jgi:predicted nucleotidyltransferase